MKLGLNFSSFISIVYTKAVHYSCEFHASDVIPYRCVRGTSKFSSQPTPGTRGQRERVSFISTRGDVRYPTPSKQGGAL